VVENKYEIKKSKYAKPCTNKQELAMIHRYTSRLRTCGNHSSNFSYKSFMYD